MVQVWKVTVESFDKTGKHNGSGSRPVLVTTFASTDSSGVPRFFDKRFNSFANAIYKLFDSSLLTPKEMVSICYEYSVSKLEKKMRDSNVVPSVTDFVDDLFSLGG